MYVGQNQWFHFGVGAPPILVYCSLVLLVAARPACAICYACSSLAHLPGGWACWHVDHSRWAGLFARAHGMETVATSTSSTCFSLPHELCASPQLPSQLALSPTNPVPRWFSIMDPTSGFLRYLAGTRLQPLFLANAPSSARRAGRPAGAGQGADVWIE